MRSTITLDPDVTELVRREMHDRRASFKQVVNDGLRAALRDTRPAEPFETPTFDLGAPRTDLDRALALAGALEDEERLQRLAGGR
ncbi:MAG: antitoxin [Trueperaceae bacterium]|nr:antitoxin [Trueperaceae bacterium]